MNDFTASNGVRFKELNERLKWSTDLYPSWHDIGEDPGGDGAGYGVGSLLDDALVEYYRSREDERLGRWRWPGNPDYVVYPPEPGFDFDAFVVDEVAGASSEFRRGGEFRRSSGMRDAADAYFAAHPAPKPWHSAEEGDVWVLTIDHAGVTGEFGNQVACTVDRGDFVAVKGLMRIDIRDAQIIAAVQIWPVVDAEIVEDDA